MHGQFIYDSSWGPELRLTARLAFLFDKMPPQDLVAFLQFAKKLWKFREGRFAKDDMVWLVCAGAIKWPLAVDALWDYLMRRSASSTLAGEIDAETIWSGARTAIRGCDAAALPEMHAEISVTGRTAAHSGPKWLGEKLRIIEVAAQTSKVNASEMETVRLGKRSIPCGMRTAYSQNHESRAACQDLLDSIRNADIVWPDSNDPAAVIPFAEAVVECIHRGLHITKAGNKNAYSATGIARKVFLFAAEMTPNMFDGCDMAKLMRWNSDEGGYMDVLKGKSVQQVREAFGMQPFMIACWTCYLGRCNEAAIKALQAASDARLLEVLATLRKEGNEHPGPHTLARVLIGGNPLKAHVKDD